MNDSKIFFTFKPSHSKLKIVLITNSTPISDYTETKNELNIFQMYILYNMVYSNIFVKPINYDPPRIYKLYC